MISLLQPSVCLRVLVSSYDELSYLINSGKLNENDSIVVNFDGVPTELSVLGIDVDKPVDPKDCAHYLTVQHWDLLDRKLPFDKDGCCDTWVDSSLRAYLQSEEYLNRYDDEFLSHLAPVVKNDCGYLIKESSFFLLSSEEINENTTIYPYYKHSDRGIKGVKFAIFGQSNYYWLRSMTEADGYGMRYAQYFDPEGEEMIRVANPMYERYFAPACVLEII